MIKEDTKTLLKFNAEGIHPGEMFFNARQEAEKAVDAYVEKYGEPMYCGFAWVDVRVERTNSKEAKMLESIGFKKSHMRKTMTMWDPAKHNGQSMDCKAVSYTHLRAHET